VLSSPTADEIRRYHNAVEKIDKSKCLGLYNKALSYENVFQVWAGEWYWPHPVTGAKGLVLGYYQPHIAGTPEVPERAEFYKTHFDTAVDYYVTVAHEAAHGMHYSDDGDAAQNYAVYCTS
jgi:hypothetical protein